jgi:peptidoglycan/LPS O-acetylase OafA/YrhL
MKINYRPEIDGLRAIAIIAVIIYHAKITLTNTQFLQGGYLGVDIFFVISGYLITSIILTELIKSNSFSFKYFYERRIRRILPVFLFVMLVALPFAWIYLLPNNFINFSKSIFYSLGFASNFYFWYSDVAYASENSLLKPFLHTWSLAIEEQYYILFPIFLFIVFKYFRKYLIFFLILGFVISLALSDWASKNHPSINFYLLPTRIWELLVGSILAYLEIEFGRIAKNKNLNSIFTISGMLLIILSFIYFDHKTFHPSFITLFPVIGVSLIIWFSGGGEIITKLLSSRLFVKIGLISFSLYLWHYPVFAFARLKLSAIDLNILTILFLLLLTLLLSILSYTFIEVPFRKKVSLNKTLITTFSLILFLIVTNLININYKGFENRFVYFNNLVKEADKKYYLNPENPSKKKIILLGNSHAYSIAHDLSEKLKNKNLSFGFFETNYYPEIIFLNRNTKEILYDHYVLKNNQIKKYFQNNQDLIVVLFSRITHYLDGNLFDNKEGGKEWLDEGLKTKKTKEILVPSKNIFLNRNDRKLTLEKNIIENINFIKNLNHKIIIVYPHPEVGFDVPKKLFKHRFKKELPILSTSYEVYKERNQDLIKLYDSIRGENIFRVYPEKIFCNKLIANRCVTNSKNKIYYFDNDHPSLEGSKLINEDIMEIINYIILREIS